MNSIGDDKDVPAIAISDAADSPLNFFFPLLTPLGSLLCLCLYQELSYEESEDGREERQVAVAAVGPRWLTEATAVVRSGSFVIRYEGVQVSVESATRTPK